MDTLILSNPTTSHGKGTRWFSIFAFTVFRDGHQNFHMARCKGLGRDVAPEITKRCGLVRCPLSLAPSLHRWIERETPIREDTDVSFCALQSQVPATLENHDWLSCVSFGVVLDSFRCPKVLQTVSVWCDFSLNDLDTWEGELYNPWFIDCFNQTCLRMQFTLQQACTWPHWSQTPTQSRGRKQSDQWRPIANVSGLEV